MTFQKKIGLVTVSLLALLFYGYTQGPVPFAENHIYISFLNFPIFVGEIALFICLLLVIIKLVLKPPRWNKMYIFPILFFVFVLLKAGWGYSHWGPLALRNSALFYYSLFAGLVYFSLDWEIYQKKRFLYIFLAMLFSLFLFRLIGIDYYFTYVVFGVCICLTFNNMKARYVILTLYLTLAGMSFVTGSRGVLVSLFLSLLLLFSVYIFWFLKLKVKYKVSILIGLSCLTITVISITGDKNAIKSFASVNEYIRNYQEMAMIARDNQDTKLPDVPIRVYHTKDSPEGKLSSIMRFPLSEQQAQKMIGVVNQRMKQVQKLEKSFQNSSEDDQEQGYIIHEQLKFINEYLAAIKRKSIEYDNLAGDQIPEDKERLLELQEILVQSQQKISEFQDRIVSKKVKYRSLDTAKGNVMWRVFVWKDMLVDLINSKNIFGLDFGKPFRSRSLEIISIVTGGDWSRGHWVGWIEPHNSYIHILYRSGIVGLFYILGMWGITIKMLIKFIREQDIKGVLLITAVFNWLFMANFAVILELPYFAIPFWCLFGFVYKYYQECKGEC